MMTAMILPSTTNGSEQRETGLSVAIEAVRAELAKSSHRQLKKVRCDVVGRILVLRGEVGTYYLKQLAQETVRKIDGVERIVNMIVVASPAEKVDQEASEPVKPISSQRVAAVG